MNTNAIKDLVSLINDSQTGRVEMFEGKERASLTDEAVRLGFFDILGDKKLTYRGYRNHINEIYSVIEETLDNDLPRAWENSPFYDQFVETRNLALGDKNEFVVEDDSIYVATSFAGNHWDTDRKKMAGNKPFSVDTSWVYIRVYDDLERFLSGNSSLETMLRKMREAMQRHVDNRISTAFAAAGSYLPTKFVKTGTYDRATMLELIDQVETASGKNAIIAGTRTGLAAITDGIDGKWISEEQKREMATTGSIVQLTGLGVNGIRIPQTFVRGTFDFAVNNKILYVMPDNEKFIKLVFEGTTRARDLGFTDTHDQTIDMQVQTKLGVSVVFSNLFGTYTLP